MTTIAERFALLRSAGDELAKDLERGLRAGTGYSRLDCFVNDAFEVDFPEDHLTRDGRVWLSLRLSMDLKGLDLRFVREAKQRLGALDATWRRLRPNFSDNPDRLDFDWHLSEGEDARDIASLIEDDARRLTFALNEMMGT